MTENISPFSSIFLLDYKFICFVNSCSLKLLLLGPGHCIGTFWVQRPHSNLLSQSELNHWAVFRPPMVSELKKHDKQFRQLAKTLKLLVGSFDQVLKAV